MTPADLCAILAARQYGETIVRGESRGFPWAFRTHPRDGHRLTVAVPDALRSAMRDRLGNASLRRHTVYGVSPADSGGAMWVLLTIVTDSAGAWLAEDVVRDALGMPEVTL